MVHPSNNLAALLDTLLTPYYDGGPFCVTVTGSGGKTTTIERLARYWADQSLKVLVTTTTHMIHPKYHTYPFDYFKVFSEGEPLYIEALPGKISMLGISVGKKIKGPSPEHLNQVLPWFDRILIEGDGAQALPLKIHATRDPVIPSKTDFVIALLGLKALGKNLNEEVMYLCQRYRELTKDESTLVTPDVYRRLLEHGEGVFKGCSAIPVALLCNQADLVSHQEALEVEKALTERWVGRPFTLVSCSWKRDEVIYYNEVVGHGGY